MHNFQEYLSTQATYAIANSTYANLASTYGGGQGMACFNGTTKTTDDKAACATANYSWKPVGNNCDGKGWLKVSGCMQMRYKYTIVGTTTGFYAHAKTDGNDLIFGCKIKEAPSAGLIKEWNNSTPGIGSRAAASGGVEVVGASSQDDGHFVTEEQGLTVAYDAVANCE